MKKNELRRVYITYSRIRRGREPAKYAVGDAEHVFLMLCSLRPHVGNLRPGPVAPEVPHVVSLSLCGTKNASSLYSFIPPVLHAANTSFSHFL